MNYIILLLFLAPVIFKLIAKYLEGVGEVEKAKQFKDLADLFKNSEKDEEVKSELEDIFPEYSSEMADEEGFSEDISVVPLPLAETLEYNVAESPQMPPTIEAHSVRNYLSEKKIDNEINDNIPEKEKLDPKKLVIYSEIMQPKF